MHTRDILKIALGFVGFLILVVGGLLMYELFFWQQTTIVEQQIQEESSVETVDQNKWEDRGNEAIEIVKSKKVTGLDDEDAERLGSASPTLDKVLGDEQFREETLNYHGAEPAGWEATWWGETKHGDHFYRVRFALKTGAVTVGPSWVVDLKAKEAKAKNLTARVAENPEDGRNSEYYGKAQQVISALTSHTFESGVTLGATLIFNFTRRTKDDAKNDIVGWTIQHDRNSLFTAYFQWEEDDRPTYAEFRFDYENRKLRAVNLHAGNIMEVGETFDDTTAVNILPKSYDPTGDRPEDRWTGAAGEQYQDPDNRPRFEALEAILSRSDLIDGIEWLLTAEVEEANVFAACKEAKRCRWIPEKVEGKTYRVTYTYNLESQPKKSISWKVDLDSGDIEPEGRVSQLAYRVLHPRS